MIANSICYIVACYNDEKVISATINSIIHNLGDQDRVLIVDGASSDGSIEIIKSFAANDSRIDFISEKDNGIYDAWNKAIDVCQSEWLSFVGCGDLLRADFRRKMLPPDLNSSDVNFIHCHARQIITQSDHYLLLGQLGAPLNPDQFKHRMKVSQCGALHHISLFSERRFNTSYLCNSDYLFLLDQLDILKDKFVDEDLVFMDSGGISSRSLLLFWEELKMKRQTSHSALWKTYVMMVPRVTKRIYFITWRKIKGVLDLGKPHSMEDLTMGSLKST
jgi:glycosyltransferase involved in cell wall biosynthesis